MDEDAILLRPERERHGGNMLRALQVLHELDAERLRVPRGAPAWERMLLRVDSLSTLGQLNWWLRLAHQHSQEPPLMIVVGADSVHHGDPWELRIEYDGQQATVVLPFEEG